MIINKPIIKKTGKIKNVTIPKYTDVEGMRIPTRTKNIHTMKVINEITNPIIPIGL